MSLVDSSEALKIISEIEVGTRPTGPMWLWDACGHVLAEDVATPRDIPPFDRAAMDGYAVRSVDVREVPRRLEVKAIRKAGDGCDLSLGPGQCVKIMTGAAVPGDADAVVMIEKTESDDPGRYATVLKSVEPFENVARKGEDAPAGSVVLREGQLLTGQALSVAAGVGRSMVKVYQQPEVSILQTGGELVEPGTEASGNKIYNSNGTLLAGLVRDAGVGRSRYQGICRDDREALAAAVRTGLASDLLLLTGGISKGDFDYVPEVLKGCGVTLQFHGVAVKPGRPLLFGSTVRGSYVFGLPGNPVSVMVCFYEYVLPMLRRLCGRRSGIMPVDLKGTLTGRVSKKAGRLFNCPALLTCREGSLFAEPLSGHGSGDYVAAARANGVIVLPEESTGASAGDEVVVHLWQMPVDGRQER